MSITLDATLQTAQDGINHRPIVEIISSPSRALIPVTGNYLNTRTGVENNPNIIYTSGGRLAGVYYYNTSYSSRLKYIYTPTDQSEWIEVNVTTPWNGDVKQPTLCELSDGNIGIVFINGNDLYYTVITPTGTLVTASTEFYNPASGVWTSTPYVIKLADDSYLLVVAEGTGTPPDQTYTYTLEKFTSSNFTSWTGPTTITLTGLSDNNYRNNPHLFQLSTGRIFLHFDYLTNYVNEVEINNLFYCYSDDNGATWSIPVQITSNTTLGTRELHPVVLEEESGSLTLMYHTEQNVKTLDRLMDGYPEPYFRAECLQLDQTNNKLYIMDDVYDYVVDVDIPTWEYERRYGPATSPAVPALIPRLFPSIDGYTVCKSDEGGVVIINHTDETFIHLVHGDNYNHDAPSGGIHGAPDGPSAALLRQSGTELQVWMIYRSPFSHKYITVGYVDIASPPDPITGLYTYTSKFTVENGSQVSRWQYIEGSDWIIVNSVRSYTGVALVIFEAETGTIIKNYYSGAYAQIPYEGVRSVVYFGGYIWFTFPYYSGQPDKRGLARIDLTTDHITYYQPNWVTTNDFYLDNLIIMEGTTKIAMTCNIPGDGGIAVFDTADYSWYQYNNTTLPGLIKDGYQDYHWEDLVYDPVNELFYATLDPYISYNNQMSNYVVCFSVDGQFSILKYASVTTPDTTPEYAAGENFSYDDNESQAAIVMDGDNVMWALWTHLEDDEYSIQWANLTANKYLEDYLRLDTSVSIDWDLDRPTKLTFGLSHGHLFDPQNLLSTWSVYLKKGRTITIREGERVGGVEYWQNQGTFIVTEQSLSYTSDKYPGIDIIAEDTRCLWEDNHVIATEYFNGETPVVILETILDDQAQLEADEINLPAAFTGTHDIYHQYLDMTLEDIIKSLLDHFAYYPFVNVDGQFEPRHLNINKSTDHTYSDLTKITEYTPDGKYSTFINRVVVRGISNYYTEVLYEEEAVCNRSGTTGWWGKKEDEQVWYSENHTRTCRYPRMEVIQSVKEFGKFIRFAGTKGEYISSVDSDEQYCVVTIEAPNMVPTLIACIAAAVATYSFCAGNCDGGPRQHGWCSACNYAVIVELNIIIYILSGVASYAYNIWARPIGHEKTSHQAEANDYDFQAELNGKVISEEIDDPYCYTISLCQTVADQEMDLISAQRNRCKFVKTAHLQDEIGDIIEVPHPYSSESMKTMIAKLKREMRVGKYFLDHIEGWRLLS